MAATDFIWGRYPVKDADLPYKNTSGSAIAVGQVLKLDTGNVISGTQPVFGMVPTAAITDVPDGVAVENLAIGAVGRIQTLGVAVCIAAGAISAGAMVGPSATAGYVTTYTANDPCVGKAWSTTANSGDPILVRLTLTNLA